jgi:hypothetical protein
MNDIAIPLLALACVWLVLLPRPELGFRRFLFLLPFLPTYFALRVEGFAITSARLATVFLLLSVVLREPHRFRFRMYAPDWWFALYVVILLVNTGTSVEPAVGLQYCFGQFMDVGVPYLLVRMFVRSREDLARLFHALLAPTSLVAVIAIVQWQTGFNVFNYFKTGSDDLGLGEYIEGMVRQGQHRADAGLSHFIMLGVFFAMLLPIANIHLRTLGYTSQQVLIRLGVLGLGLISSVSGGAMLAGMAAVGFVMLWPLRQLWILFVLAFIGLVAFVEIFSNRSFLTVLAMYSATDPASANYRIWAPERWMHTYLPGHWLFGYGVNLPSMGDAGDITNHYFIVIFRAGLTALVPFVGSFVAGFVALHRAARIAPDGHLPKTCWAVAASLTCLLVVMVTVSFFGQMVSYLSMLLALPSVVLVAASTPALVGRRVAPGEALRPPRSAPGFVPTR